MLHDPTNGLELHIINSCADDPVSDHHNMRLPFWVANVLMMAQSFAASPQEQIHHAS